MGIWRLSLENKFWTIYEQQSEDTTQKIVLAKSEGCSCARELSVAFLFSIHVLVYNFFPPSCRLMYEKLKTQLKAS